MGTAIGEVGSFSIGGPTSRNKQFVRAPVFVSKKLLSDNPLCIGREDRYNDRGAGGRGGPTDEPRQGRNAATVVCSTLPRSSGVLRKGLKGLLAAGIWDALRLG